MAYRAWTVGGRPPSTLLFSQTISPEGRFVGISNGMRWGARDLSELPFIGVGVSIPFYRLTTLSGRCPAGILLVALGGDEESRVSIV